MMYYNERLNLLGFQVLAGGVLLEVAESEFMVLTEEWVKL